MGGMETALELILAGLLVATLVHAIRLQRAIGALQRDRQDFDEAVTGFETGARQAELGLRNLKEATGTVGARIEEMTALREDLTFLTQRGTQMADRLETLIRSARPLMQAPEPVVAAPAPSVHGAAPVRSQAERDLLLALRAAR